MKANNKKEKYEKIMEKKLGTPIEILCKGFPNEFVTYLSYCRNLKFEDKPDYSYLKALFKDLFVKSGYEYYQYDWNIVAKKKKEEKKKEGGEDKMNAEMDISKNSGAKDAKKWANTQLVRAWAEFSFGKTRTLDY